jgi:hypothetical protein
MSPLVKIEIAKNVTAVSRDRNEPTIRPTTPKCAPLETALFVPLTGPNSAMGARMSPPTTIPSRTASTPSQKDRPKSRIGNVPSTTVAKVFAPPNATRKRSNGARCGPRAGSARSRTARPP